MCTTKCHGCEKVIEYNDRIVDPISFENYCQNCVDEALAIRRHREIRGF